MYQLSGLFYNFWARDKPKVNEQSCTCSCFDTIFRGAAVVVVVDVPDDVAVADDIVFNVVADDVVAIVSILLIFNFLWLFLLVLQ